MDKAAVADLTADMLMRGTAKHTRQQIKDELDRLKARVIDRRRADAGDGRRSRPSARTCRRCSRSSRVLREPAFPASEFEQLRQENLAGIEQQRTEPSALASNAFSRHINPYPKGDVRYVPTPRSRSPSTRAATLEQVKAFYTAFYGASVGELAIVGDFDAAAEKQVTELFGYWKSPHSFTRVPRPYQEVDALDTVDRGAGQGERVLHRRPQPEAARR